MIFMVAFIVLCILTVRNSRKLKKFQRRLDSFEVTLRLKDSGDVTQTVPGDPAQLPQ